MSDFLEAISQGFAAARQDTNNPTVQWDGIDYPCLTDKTSRGVTINEMGNPVEFFQKIWIETAHLAGLVPVTGNRMTQNGAVVQVETVDKIAADHLLQITFRDPNT